MQSDIIPPVDISLIEAELTPERHLRATNRAGNDIYVIDAHSAPHTMREIGRLREISFRAGGGGTGKACDIDEFDLMDPPCRQLLVWNPEKHEIIGAYRYILGSDIRLESDGSPRIATAHMFRFSPEFLRQMLPHTIELGRSWVRPEYQSTRAGVRAIYALDNLWDGLGALTVLHPEVRYLFGKMTMYPSYDRACRNLLLHFLNLYFPDPDGIIRPIEPLADTHSVEAEQGFFVGDDFKEDYRRLNTFVRSRGINIPPLINAYMGLSPSMRILGTAINHEFGDVEETGLLITIADIFDDKIRRHVASFKP
ncbi:MAG: GNAT family N-acetyltransferase [Muribaculaceae bacterium]|nr:GNAT family N-acetyltransferase [Muribaculaceae bacterium]